jgi:hypothetical protein
MRRFSERKSHYDPAPQSSVREEQQIDMLNKLFSYIYNIFSGHLTFFCAKTHQLLPPVQEIRAIGRPIDCTIPPESRPQPWHKRAHSPANYLHKRSGSDHWPLWISYNVGSGSSSNSNAAAGYFLDTGEGARAMNPRPAIASTVRRRFCALYAPL